MKNHNVKGLTMAVIVLAIVLVSAAASANAQSAKKVSANIPFDFVVGDQTMTAGDYNLRATTAPDNGLLIQGDNGQSSMRLTNSIEPRKDRRNSRLVFHRYGQRYFLAEVWTGAGNVGRHLLKSRQERAIQRELSSIASKSGSADDGCETVEVVAVLR